MIRLITSEWIKATSTKMWWILFIFGALLTVLSTGGQLLLVGVTEVAGEEIQEMGFTDEGMMRGLLATMGSAQLIALILGILGFTGEYRHMTITDTFLTEPRRSVLIAAKALVYAALGVLLALVTCAVALLLILVSLGTLPAPPTVSMVVEVGAGVLLSYALYAILGVAIGALVTNQIAALVLALLWVLLIEPILTLIWPHIGQWLPGGAASGILNAQVQTIDGFTDLLPVWLATLVLLGYAVAFSLAAGLTTLRRDIT
jgi:ABC-2 type transport system permease protein